MWLRYCRPRSTSALIGSNSHLPGPGLFSPSRQPVRDEARIEPYCLVEKTWRILRFLTSVMIPLKNPLFTKIRDDENDQPYSESRLWGICERKILASFLAEDFFSGINSQARP